MISSEILNEALDGLGIRNAEILNQGGQKVVYVGNISSSRAVAKIVHLEHGPVAEIALKRAHREVELLAAIDSPHFVKVLSDAIVIGEPPQAVAWVEEFLDGEDFGTHFQRACMDEKEAVRFLFDVAVGLKACHDLEVVHRDMSPGNIRRTSNGNYVIMDPGLARHLEKTAITGVFQPGTPGFRSPEHVPGNQPQCSSDIFCVGILTYWALSKKLPLFDPDHHSYETNLKFSPVPPIQSVSTINDSLARIVDRCLHKQPARRYIDGAELLEALITEFGERP